MRMVVVWMREVLGMVGPATDPTRAIVQAALWQAPVQPPATFAAQAVEMQMVVVWIREVLGMVGPATDPTRAIVQAALWQAPVQPTAYIKHSYYVTCASTHNSQLTTGNYKNTRGVTTGIFIRDLKFLTALVSSWRSSYIPVRSSSADTHRWRCCVRGYLWN